MSDVPSCEITFEDSDGNATQFGLSADPRRLNKIADECKKCLNHPAATKTQKAEAALALRHLKTAMRTISLDGEGIAHLVAAVERFARIQHLPEYPHAKRGRKVLEGARYGHTVVHGSDRAKQDRRKDVMRRWNRIRDEHPEYTMTGIDSMVAREFRCCSKTVSRIRSRK